MSLPIFRWAHRSVLQKKEKHSSSLIQVIADYQHRHPYATAGALGLLGGAIIAGGVHTSDNTMYAQDGRKVLKKDAGSSANLTLKVYTSDDSTAVLNYLANLRSGTQIIKSLTPAAGSNAVTFTNLATPVEQVGNEIPTGYDLMQNYPNPFNPSTTIRFAIPKQGPVSIKAYNEAGQEVGTLVDKVLDAGVHQFSWSPNTASGVYFVDMVAGNYRETIKTVNLGSGNGSSIVSAPSIVGSVQQPQASFNDVTGFHASLGKILQQYGIDLSGGDPPLVATSLGLDLTKDTILVVYAKRDQRSIGGTLTDYEGKPVQGYLLAINANKDTAVAKADANGRFALNTKRSLGDTIKAQILNKNHPDGFIRTIYAPGGLDLNNLTIDAIPLLADSVFIGPDTLASFAWEANFQPWSHKYEGLKKADLNNLFEVISSTSWKGGKITPDEQLSIKQIIGQDTLYNPAPVQEGLSARVAPSEVGITSKIKPSQTVLHKNTAKKEIQPADDWLILIAENYAPKTSFYVLMKIGNLEQVYNRLKK
ncbi:MAG: T9SS type A sorting domain-containing protein [bacterium]